MIDQDERKRAILAQQSFIVQAPAGSGKTSLLTQRYLSLLSTVEHPENILAITFTNKAAAEMRERIVDLLSSPESEPDNDYQRTNQTLVRNALHQNQRCGWQLERDHERLRIMTIDAFCLMLGRQMPVASQMIPYNHINDDPLALYQSAAFRFIEDAQSSTTQADHFNTVLNHLGNNSQLFSDMCVTLLQRRDQWLASVFGSADANHQLVDAIVDRVVAACEQYCDIDIKATIRAILSCQPQTMCCTTKEFWQRASDVFLTQSLGVKRRFTHKEGIPPLSKIKNSEEATRIGLLKQQCQQISDYLADTPALVEQLRLCRHIPKDLDNTAQQQVWQSLKALLPRLVAELHLCFAETGTTDFSEIALQAIQALGDDEQPTDLALRLDYDIQHLLVDEFQDTSELQYTLFERLTSNWAQTPSKTVFFVGDPMQSIYRFREAEVSLFVRTQTQGISDIPVQPLFLQTNFRSDQQIVALVNHYGEQCFPVNVDPLLGAVTYHSSTAIHPLQADNIIAKQCANVTCEADLIADYIKQHPDEDIAILVRSRRQLAAISSTLQAHAIEIEGHDLVPLNQHPVINLLWQLTQVIHSPHHTIAFVSLLRSPLCGISLRGLVAIADLLPSCYQMPLGSLNTQLQSLLSEEDDNLMRPVLGWLYWAWQQLGREGLYDLVTSVWKGLNGDCLIDATNTSSISQFWMLLHHYSDWPISLTHLATRLTTTFSQNHQSRPVKIMTIHKAKGLEFDTVILPGLNCSPGASKPSLIYWLKAAFSPVMLVAPIQSTYDKDDNTVNFIKFIDKQRALNEQKRLLYVALTRAKHRLLLTSHQLNQSSENSFHHDLSTILDFVSDERHAVHNEQMIRQHRRFRLTASAAPPPTWPTGQHQKAQVSDDPNYYAQMGEFLHQKLQWYATYHQPHALTDPILKRWYRQLQMAALSSKQIDQAIIHVKTLWETIHHCKTARWILKPRSSAKNEYAIDTQHGRCVIDRLFEEGDQCWIIDYKFLFSNSADIAPYQQQLHHYAQLCQQLGYTKVQLMLYFPLQREVIQWQYHEQIGITT